MMPVDSRAAAIFLEGVRVVDIQHENSPGQKPPVFRVFQRSYYGSAKKCLWAGGEKTWVP
jgi:hypothetical protein